MKCKNCGHKIIKIGKNPIIKTYKGYIHYEDGVICNINSCNCKKPEPKEE